MNTYDKRDPLTYCSNCQVEAFGETKPGSHGICARHAKEVLGEVQRQFPPMTFEEWAAHDAGLKRFKASPEVREALEQLRMKAELARARKAAKWWRRFSLAVEIVGGAFCAAVFLYCMMKLAMLLAK